MPTCCREFPSLPNYFCFLWATGQHTICDFAISCKLSYPLQHRTGPKCATYQMVHLWMHSPIGSIWQLANKNQATWFWLLDQQMLNTSHCLLIHISQICNTALIVCSTTLLEPNFEQIFIIAVSTWAEPYVATFKLPWLWTETVTP
jgi:hypothetical protein